MILIYHCLTFVIEISLQHSLQTNKIKKMSQTTTINVKMFLFARWLTTCYADTHLDHKMRCNHDEGFKGSEAMSVLNRETGYWYKKQLEHFNYVVYPNYIKNGTVKNTKQFFDCAQL